MSDRGPRSDRASEAGLLPDTKEGRYEGHDTSTAASICPRCGLPRITHDPDGTCPLEPPISSTASRDPLRGIKFCLGFMLPFVVGTYVVVVLIICGVGR